MTKELTIEKKTVKDNQKILEEEILQRVTIENELQSMMENFKFKEEVNLILIILYFFALKTMFLIGS